MYSAEASESNVIYLLNENEYRRYFDTARTGIIYLNSCLQVKLMNGEAAKICNVAYEKVKGKSAKEVFSHLGERFTSLIRDNDYENINTTIVRLKHLEQCSYIQVTSFAITSEDDNSFIGLVIIIQDISAFRAAVKQIQTTQMLLSLGELAAGVAHHVRTPLSTISGYLQVMLGRLTDDRYTVKRDVLEMLLDEVNYINNVVTELVMFAKPPVKKEPGVNVNRTLEEALLLTFRQVGGESIELKKELTKNLPLINADANLLKQTFVNVLQNAIEAMPDKGVLTTKTWFNSDINMIVVSIADTGCGVMPEVLPRVFEPFYTTKLDRMGLGLPTAYRIITEHGGFINIVPAIENNSTNSGTKINIYLPIIDEKVKKLTVIHQQILNLQ